MDNEILEVIHDTIAEREAACPITLYDIYGSTNGFHVTEFKIQKEEDAEYKKPAKLSDYRQRRD